MSFDLRPCTMNEVQALCALHHGYGSAGDVAVYAWGVYEGTTLVAAYAWQPPAPGASNAVCPEAPYGVLMLSRMVAVPKEERALKHISKPLMVQMKRLIDRTRWPVLITYSDEGEGHTGYVYQCSGWEKTTRNKRKTYELDGKRVSPYSNGAMVQLEAKGTTWVQRWEHWDCPRGAADAYMEFHGWVRIPIAGKKWRSGNHACRIEKRETIT